MWLKMEELKRINVRTSKPSLIDVQTGKSSSFIQYQNHPIAFPSTITFLYTQTVILPRHTPIEGRTIDENNAFNLPTFKYNNIKYLICKRKLICWTRNYDVFNTLCIRFKPEQSVSMIS